jgi:hypothetical protein
MATGYLAELSVQSGIQYFPTLNTFKTDQQSSKATALGIRSGFPLAIGLTSGHNVRNVAVMIRFRRQGDVSQLSASLKELPEFKTFTGRKTLKVQDDGVYISWPYVLKKPDAQSVIALIDSVITIIKQFVPVHDGKCDDCQMATASTITLVNNIPGFHCAGCQARFAEAKDREAQDYAKKTALYLPGFLTGAGAAIIAGLAWGLLISWIELGSNEWYPKLHICASAAIAIFVGWAFFKGAQKVDRLGQAIAIVLALSGKFLGDGLYYSKAVAAYLHSSVTPHIVTVVVKHFFQLKLDHAWGLALLIADFGFALCIPWMPGSKIPKFKPTFVAVQGDQLVPVQAATSPAVLSTI